MLKAKIERIEGERVMVVFEDGQRLTVPRTAIEGVVGVGQDIVLVAAVLGGEDAGRSRLAQEILNELLRPSGSA
jgi:hypothetical protein